MFRWSKIKLQRARKFIDELEVGLVAYNENAPISAEWDYSGAEPAIKVYWKEVDPYLLAALGDAIHNIRTALDLMASELARINGNSDEDVYFPFAKSAEYLPRTIRNKNFHLAGDDAVALLMQFAPYTGGNAKLRAIHDLDIQDKHTSILTTKRDTHGLQLSYRLDAGLKPPVSVVNAAIAHGFLEPPLEGMPLVETLKELVELVDGIIEAFASMVELRLARGGE